MMAAAAEREPLVLVPGLLCDGRLWQPQIAALADIADCWVADIAGADTLEALAAGVLRDAPFQRFALAGLSMGGYVAMEIVRRAPGRVTRLALLDTSARADAPGQRRRREDFIALAARGRFPGVTDALLPGLVHPQRLADDELTGIVKAMAASIGKEAFVRQERAIMGRADSLPSLAAVRCPTLVLCGRQDQLTPLERHEEMVRAIPGARLVVIEDCGHLSTLERPAEVNDALRKWLEPAAT